MSGMNYESRVRVLQQIVDEATLQLMIGGISLAEAENLAQRVRNQARLLLPTKMDTFDLIYRSRLRRLIDQFVRPNQLV
jgi:hypothetical protein